MQITVHDCNVIHVIKASLLLVFNYLVLLKTHPYMLICALKIWKFIHSRHIIAVMYRVSFFPPKCVLVYRMRIEQIQQKGRVSHKGWRLERVSRNTTGVWSGQWHSQWGPRGPGSPPKRHYLTYYPMQHVYVYCSISAYMYNVRLAAALVITKTIQCNCRERSIFS